MAEKKESLSALKMQLGKLLKKEQTPEVMEQVDVLKLRIETMEAEKSKEPPKESPKQEAPKANQLKAFEKWSLDPKDLSRVKKLKDITILQEHADTLNQQKKNTLVEYIEKEG